MKSRVRFIGFASKFLLMCILLHYSSALPLAKLSAAPPPKNHDGEAKAASSSKSATSKAVSLPLFFEANKGQTDPRVRFLTRSAGYTLFLTPTETVLAESKTQIARTGNWGGGRPEITPTAGSFVRMQLVGANPSPVMTGLEEFPGKVNYLIGRDPSQWQTGVSLFSKVRTEQVYPRVDLLFHGDERQLEYDFIVAPGADPSKIAFRIRGAKRIEIDSRGDLVLHTAKSEFRMQKPMIYQAVGSERRLIEGGFIKKGIREVGFRVGNYNHSQVLIIDPVVIFATFLGGNGIDLASGIAVDDTTPSSPKLFVTGTTTDSTTFPETFNVIGSPTSTAPPIVGEVGFIAKIDPTATGSASLIYLTFVGGKKPFQAADGGCISSFQWLSLDESQGAANVQPVIGGATSCSDFPTTIVLSPVTGPSNDDIGMVVTRLTSSGAAVDQAALLGGNHAMSSSFVSVSNVGNVTVSGATEANMGLHVMNPYVATFNNGTVGFSDCYVANLERSDLKITYATYTNTGTGSTQKNASGCGAFEDSSGDLLVGGNTVSATVFNLGAGGANLANGFQPNFQGTGDTFAMKLNPNLVGVNQLVYGTYFGGGGNTRAQNGSFDLGNGVVAIVGRTNSATNSPNSPDIPLKNAFQNSNLAAATAGGQTGYLLVLDTTQNGANSLVCSTYFGGGSGVDDVRAVSYDAADPTSFRIVIGGETQSSADFPILNPIQPFAGTVDAFVSVLKVPTPGQNFAASLYFSTFIGSGVVSAAGGQKVDNERILGLAVDSNHTIYGSGNALSSNFFANTNPATTVKGFQPTCTSCGQALPLSDTAIFAIGTGGIANVSSITVSPANPSLAQGKPQQFTALAFFNDGTVQDITTTATWASSATNIATISNAPGSQGLATASATNIGLTNITASQGGVTSPADVLTVTGTQQFTLTVTDAGTGSGTVTSQNGLLPAINCTTGGPAANCAANYNSGTIVTLTGTAATGSTFTGFTGDCAGTAPCNVVMSQARNVTATFNIAAAQVTLTVSLSGTNGSVVDQDNAGKIQCSITGGVVSGTCSAPYNPGTPVSLQATGGTGSSFNGWTAGPCGNTSTDPCAFTITTNTNATATFSAAAAAPVIVADWNVSGGGANDKQRTDGKTPPLTVKLTNTSASQTVHVAGASADNPAYTVKTTCSTLGPGQSCTVSASFTATSLCQPQNTTVTVADDDPGGNFTFTIDGFGADSGLQVDDLTDPNLTAQSLAQSLVGPGVTISNVTYTGAKRAAGTFSSSSNIIGFNSGIVLSTGSVRNTVGPNCSTGISVDNGEPGDPDLTTLSGGATNDAAVLQFDFVPTSTSVSFQYVFASDEYPEFVGQFNDTFAFFLNGANIALIPGTNLPVTINDVNSGSNPQFFVNNNFQSPTAAPVDTEMDGLTVVLTAQAAVTPGNTYHIKLAIADALDFALDSNVFIKAGSLSSTSLSFSPSSVAFGNQPVGVQSAGMPVTLTNNGTTAVNISGIAATPPFGETNNCPAQLAPMGQTGSSCIITVTITPSSATTFTGSLTVTSNSPTAGSQQSIPLSGTGTSTGAAVLSITKTHTGNFTQGQQGARHTVTVSNAAGAGSTSGTVTVTDTFPAGLTLVSMAGTGWTCGTPNPANVCTRADALAGGVSYPTITVTVNVAANATSPQVNTVSVSGGGSPSATATDSTIITVVTPPALSISKTHTGNFTQGQQGATYTVTVSNASTAGPTSGTVTVTETVPSGLTLVSMAGTGWTCGNPNSTNVCTRTDSLGGDSSYPSITVTVNVAANATSPQVNSVTVSGGGSASATATDLTTIITNAPVLKITKTHSGSFLNGQQGATYTVTVSNTAGAGATSGTVTVTDSVPQELTLVSMAGTGWTCGTPNPANACTRTDALAGGGSYPAITVTVNVANDATSPQVNAVTVSGGGSASATANDSTTITNSPVVITVAPPPPGQPATPTINPGGAAVYGLVLTSQPGFFGTITLSCTATTSTGAPASQFITCAPDPNSVVIKQGGTTQVAIVLNTFCSQNAPLDMPVPGGPAGVSILLLTALALASVTWMYRRRPRWVLTFAALTIAVYSIVGCGSTPKGTAGRTPAGPYNLSLSFIVNGKQPPIQGPVLPLMIE